MGLRAVPPRLDGLGGREHADLHGCDVDILEDHVDLARDEIRRHDMDRRDAARILRGQQP